MAENVCTTTTRAGVVFAQVCSLCVHCVRACMYSVRDCTVCECVCVVGSVRVCNVCVCALSCLHVSSVCMPLPVCFYLHVSVCLSMCIYLCLYVPVYMFCVCDCSAAARAHRTLVAHGRVFAAMPHSSGLPAQTQRAIVIRSMTPPTKRGGSCLMCGEGVSAWCRTFQDIRTANNSGAL